MAVSLNTTFIDELNRLKINNNIITARQCATRIPRSTYIIILL